MNKKYLMTPHIPTNWKSIMETPCGKIQAKKAEIHESNIFKLLCKGSSPFLYKKLFFIISDLTKNVALGGRQNL